MQIHLITTQKTIVFKDESVVENVVIRPVDLPKGTDTAPLYPYRPTNRNEYEAVVNMVVQSKQLLMTPGRVKGAVEGLVMKYGALMRGLPASMPYEGVDYTGVIHPVFPHEKMKVDTHS